ncbi:DUF6191 domain-containing protein [Actinokineospora globicatena]|uniref:DUF6191 domain-containing protein n=1 Tax=Actinokineospora globicatena TaxID=103729 RepID=UPI0020A503E6|nr:DUF6191 domain-containing protein [Actinokineospora globicatena]MCP2304551.1 hypothetical protein [Actinokineospora globicatena]GLW78080.1 hypothetical protein Aglo01_25620 [Actinokineospora globicatena]GLW85254.1 hypothetical protein Aglo02_28940 [Actinokineospora globicatena]
MTPLELILSLSIPASSLGVVAFGVHELRRRKNKGLDGAPLTATYVNEFTALFYASKRMELDHRDTMSMMREEDSSGARPWDLTNGIVLPRRPPTQP